MSRTGEPRRPLLMRIVFWLIRRHFGQPIRSIEETFGSTAPSRSVMHGHAAFEYFLHRSNSLDQRLKLLAAAKVTMCLGCPTCLAGACTVGRAHGITEAQLRDLHAHSASAAFSEHEKLILDFAEQLTRDPMAVPESLRRELECAFSGEQLVELAAAVAMENYRVRFRNALRRERWSVSEDELCLIPLTGDSAPARGGPRTLRMPPKLSAAR